MTNHLRRTFIPRQRTCFRMQRGFSMIEVLVSILILAIGVIGAAGLQLGAIRATKQTSLQTIALQLASEIADKMRSNDIQMKKSASPFLAVDYQSAIDGEPKEPTMCYAKPCDAAELAAFDIYEWKKRVRDALPSGRVKICRDASPWDSSQNAFTWDCDGSSGDSASYVVKVGWQGKNPDGSLILDADKKKLPAKRCPDGRAIYPMKAAYRMRGRGVSGNEAGLTLVELMIAITLGLLVVMVATALLLSTKSGYIAQDGDAQVQDNGRYALDIIGRAVRQAAYENWDSAEAPVLADVVGSANIAGLDAHRLSKTSDDITDPLDDAVNGSDVLAVRFFGAGSGTDGDGTMLNCAGFSTPAASSPDERGWSIFFVANDDSGVPELRCKYRGKDKKWHADAIARGVESFQVLYGIDTDGDGMPNQMMNATAINALDKALVLEGATPDERAKDKNRKTNWKKVVTVKVALLVRGEENARAESLTTTYDLFGSKYPTDALTDTGVRIKEEDLSESVRGRIRKVFASTIQLRNQPMGGA